MCGEQTKMRRQDISFRVSGRWGWMAVHSTILWYIVYIQKKIEREPYRRGGSPIPPGS